MRLSNRVPRWWPLRRLSVGALIVGGSSLLAACGAGSSIPSLSDGLFSTQSRQQTAVTPADSYFLAADVCPEIQIRGGTESIRVYARGGDDDPDQIRYQASIGETARECRNGGQGVIVRVGVKGRVVAGPKGGADNITVPVRVAVLEDSTDVVYSQLHQVAVVLTAPTFGENFALVDENVTFPVRPGKSYRVYVGFDKR